jgi:TolB protein
MKLHTLAMRLRRSCGALNIRVTSQLQPDVISRKNRRQRTLAAHDTNLMLNSVLRLSIALALAFLVCACDDAGSTPEAVPSSQADVPPAVTPTATPVPIVATPAVVDTSPALPARGGAIAASVYRDSNWDIYILSPSAELLRRLTFGEGSNRAPSWSPDGQSIAFESNRNHNWDVYSMRADGSELRRLTDDPHFDGSPRWSPDGRYIAFTSDRAGSLDIWVMRADGSEAVKLPSNSPSLDYDPAWSPDGKQIAFTSLRDGANAIFLMNADGSNVRRLTPESVGQADQPSWSPDGAHIAFVAEKYGAREIYQIAAAGSTRPGSLAGVPQAAGAAVPTPGGVPPAGPQNLVRVTALEYHQWPVWAPDGASLIFVAQSESGQVLESVQPGRPAMRMTFDDLWYRQPDWSAKANVESDPSSLQQTDDALYVEKTTPNPPERADRYNLAKLNGVRVIVPMLSDAVDDSFVAARQRVVLETGWDFMAQLSEAVRPLTFKSVASDYLSWHKAGRAIDLLFTFPTPKGQALEISREDILGDTYWRLYLRAANQDGSQGEPLRVALWDFSAEARLRARGQGGLIKGVLPGYYVDLTELLRQYGWRRIASHTEPNFDWRRDYAGIEFWHYQKTDELTWWQAIREIYAPKDLGDMFSYQTLVRAHYDISTIVQKGVPMPSDVLLRYSTMQP